MDKSRIEPTIFFIENISFSLKLFSGHFYGQSFIKTVRGPFSVKFNGHIIKAQRSVKYLGHTLDDKLTGEAIVNSIVQKVNGRLKFLYRQCNFLEEKLRKSICLALIQCHIDYACSSWYSSLNKQLKKTSDLSRQNSMVH